MLNNLRNKFYSDILAIAVTETMDGEAIMQLPNDKAITANVTIGGDKGEVMLELIDKNHSYLLIAYTVNPATVLTFLQDVKIAVIKFLHEVRKFEVV